MPGFFRPDLFSVFLFLLFVQPVFQHAVFINLVYRISVNDQFSFHKNPLFFFLPFFIVWYQLKKVIQVFIHFRVLFHIYIYNATYREDLWKRIQNTFWHLLMNWLLPDNYRRSNFCCPIFQQTANGCWGSSSAWMNCRMPFISFGDFRFPLLLTLFLHPGF